MEGIVNMENLLQIFGRLTTTDRDDGTSAFRHHIGMNVPEFTAACYYGMYQGDLRAATFAYRQHVSTEQELPGMSAVAIWVPERDGMRTLKPNTWFPIQWQMKNTGLYPWPRGTHLTLASGFEDQLPHPEMFKALEQLIPGDERNITVRMKSPSLPGPYLAKWKMVAPCGSYCGDNLWVDVTVLDDIDFLVEELANVQPFGDF